MNLTKADLNLLVYLDVLLRERNVTRAAEQLNITQPALSNGLRRLRSLLDDPLLVRTSNGMEPTERALEIQPLLRSVLGQAEQIVQTADQFDPASSQRVFRIMASDYAESTLLPTMMSTIREQAPNIVLDVLTPSDVKFDDIELGRVDMAINRFDDMPQSLHQKLVWTDEYACLMSKNNPIARQWSLDSYLAARHVWVSKTGMGVGMGMSPDRTQRLGWVDEALARTGKRRSIAVFTRHYMVASLLAAQRDLIATLPRKAAELQSSDAGLLLLAPPFDIPLFELKLAWGPIMQHNQAHKWLRSLIISTAESLC